jgi:N-acyl-D-aspartate/D-glutamate deacylase
VLLGFELTLNPFSFHPTYREIAKAPLAERVALLADAEVRARLLSEQPDRQIRRLIDNWDQMHLMDHDRPDYEPTPDQTIGARARARGMSPEAVALDHMLSHGGRAMIYVPFLNYAEDSLDPAYAMLTNAHTVPGLSDGGAHVGMICDGSFPTSLLTHWTRDRTRGAKLPLEQAIRMQTADTAAIVGLMDRGRIAPGLRADLNVIDYQRLALRSPEVAYDLPAGGRRLIQRAEGYVATIVAGEVTYRDGEPTGALPGRLLRGAQGAPVAQAAE